MQQLFLAFGIDWRLLLIQGVNFAILLAALTYFLYRPVTKMIDDRSAKIAEGVRMADAAEGRLADAKAEGEELIGTAARDAEALVAAARTSADVKGGEIMKAAESRADALMKDAAARAEELKRQSMKESEREVVRATMLAAENTAQAPSSTRSSSPSRNGRCSSLMKPCSSSRCRSASMMSLCTTAGTSPLQISRITPTVD